jgi:hypothetical protein
VNPYALLAAFCLGLHAASLFACSAAEAVGDQQVEASQLWTDCIPHAFVKDCQIRFHFTNQAERLSLKAAWEHPRAPGLEYAYASATLEAAARDRGSEQREYSGLHF